MSLGRTPSAPPNNCIDREADNAGCVVLRGVSAALDSDVGQAFVLDCARHTEGLLADLEIKNKWKLSDEDWHQLGSNNSLLQAVRSEREHRILNGDAAREGAQHRLVKAPIVLGDILTDEKISPRHRIEAARELRQAAASGDLPVASHETIKISINLGGDQKLVYEIPAAPEAPLPVDDGELP